ncbi:MAG: tRNA (guanosine(37)-N1)-methyltransferase TrmD, partial [Chloroflexi bacterium]|nr:tRNA (guanosine(37)-N1)-methyltransferase TrmD [Chloroflexota bacterium]
MLELACRRGLISVEIKNIRDYTHDAHGTADDYQFGGGAGMVLKAEPIFEAVEDILGGRTPEQRANIPIILMSPQGSRLDQRLAESLAGAEELVLICGHYA